MDRHDDPVQFWCQQGFPRLALAFAEGTPWAPYVFNVNAQFPSADVTNVPNVGADVKLSQDTIIDEIVTRIVFQRPPGNVFQTMSDFFFNYQSGIRATLDVMGTPRYSVAPKFTPLSTLTSITREKSKIGWGLSWQQAVEMSFDAPFALPEFPCNVTVSFIGRIPQSEAYVGMNRLDAIARLRAAGYEVPDTCGQAFPNR
jgi:hypothetical protein